MSTISEQSIFAADVARLIQFIHQAGWAISLGEAWRTPEMQQIYFDQGKTLTMKSPHRDRLAIDLNFFKPATFELTYLKKDIQQFGDYWESLDTKNRWGGNFKDAKGTSFEDTPHFERKV